MKKIVRCLVEIVFSLMLIIGGYIVCNRIDVQAYEGYIAQYSLNDISLSVENGFSTLSYLSEVESVENSILSVNNYQDKVYNVEILLELNGISQGMIDNLILLIDGIEYKILDRYVSNEDGKFYFVVVSDSLKNYEKKDYNLKLLVDDNYDISNESGFSYNFIEKII